MKKIVGKVHLWLGFASGLVVFVVSITGCLLAFEWELRGLFTGSYFYTEPKENVEPLPPSVLRSIAEQELPGKPANGISYQGASYSTVVQFYGGDPEYYYQVYMDPYTGKVLKVWNQEGDFFRFILNGHFYLWLPTGIGQPIVATSTLVFLVMLISGLILWWPRNKAARKQRFSVKWDAKWRRLNYDLHNVPGFYALFIALILAITGLVWGFQWWSNGLYYATSGGRSLDESIYPVSDTAGLTPAHAAAKATDGAWRQVRSLAPAGSGISVYFAETKESPLSVAINHRPGTYYKTDNYQFDQYTLKPLHATGPYAGKYQDADFGDKLRRMNYDIHVGAVLGFPGKLLMFFASLICASLPITGVYIWWGRKKKKKYAPVAKMVAAA